MTARLVMDPNPTVLRDTDLIKTAADAIMSGRYRRLPVVNANGHFIGMFGVNCLLRLVLPRALFLDDAERMARVVHETLSDLHRRFKEVEDEPITQCMIDDAVVIRPDTPLLEALLTLYNQRVSLPVVDPESGRLEGLISYWDVGAAILAAEI